LLLAAACAREEQRPSSDATATSQAADWFIDATKASGLDFVHVNGMSGELYLAEIMGPGVGLFDYDNDGDLDAYFVQGHALESRERAAADVPSPHAGGGDRLFRNDLTSAADGTRIARFTDVTEQSQIRVGSYGMGVATGDFNNDGWTDLYLTRLGADVLLRNNGNGTFTDVTRQAGIAEDSWSVPASFLDFNRDGWLDLYVGSYVRYSLDTDIDCNGPTGAVDNCTPQAYRPQPGRLYRNRGDATFVDVSVASGLTADYGPALGSVAADIDGDRWIDLYVANDGADNQLWMNQRSGTFRNRALLAGVAVSAEGKPEGSMGVDAGDFDNDGDDDLVVTNLIAEGTALYVNDGRGTFEERGAAAGLRTASLKYTGFGAAWVDIDNDSWLDVLTVNGAVQMAQPFARRDDPFPLDQPMQLLRNSRKGRFEDATTRAGTAFQTLQVGRGAAFGDIDNDGDTDVLIVSNNGPARLLLNQIGNRQHWLGLELVAASGARHALGARVHVVRGSGPALVRRARSDGSYAAANDPRVLVGLGDSAEVPRIRIEWPSGRTEERTLDGIDRWITMKEGGG
jgi:hypothetical protein